MRLFTTLILLGSLTLGGRLWAEVSLPDGLYAEFTLARGTVVAELLARQAPLTVTHFVGLAEGTLGPDPGTPYYRNLTWYRVAPGFVIQSGNPRGTTDDDSDDIFPDEFVPGLRHDTPGILSMANAGPDTNGTQFFITLAPAMRLNYLHSVFGRVVRGLELLPQIKPGEPFSIKILRRGPVARAFRADAAAFRALVARAPRYRAEPVPGPTANFDDPDQLLPALSRALAFNYKLANFERATGIRIVARLFSSSPPAAEDEVAGAYMHRLAEKLGVAQRGALAAYFAADDDWRVWIGDDLTAAFLGRPATPADLAEGAAFHDAKDTLLDATRAEAEALYLSQRAATPALPPAQRLKLQTDTLLDGLILKLEP